MLQEHFCRVTGPRATTVMGMPHPCHFSTVSWPVELSPFGATPWSGPESSPHHDCVDSGCWAHHAFKAFSAWSVV